MDTTDEEITFNKEGVCNHCLNYDEKEKERQAEKGNLNAVVARIKKDGEGKDYDVLLGVSGGVDSSLCLHYLVQLGLRPLCFSVDNGWNTPEADENIMRLVEGCRVPFYRYTIDLKDFRSLQQAFIRSGTPNIEIPTDHILMATTYELARQYGIKWIISGGNLATESVMPKSWGYNARDLRFIKDVARIHGADLGILPTISLLGYLYCRFIKKIRIVNLLDYFEYNRKEAVDLLSAQYGYKPYGEKHGESKFTKWFQNNHLPYFGIIKERAHQSSLVLSGQRTRQEALTKLESSPQPFADVSGVGFSESPLGAIGFHLKHTHKDFKNSEWIWSLLSKLYGNLKRL